MIGTDGAPTPQLLAGAAVDMQAAFMDAMGGFFHSFYGDLSGDTKQVDRALISWGCKAVRLNVFLVLPC